MRHTFEHAGKKYVYDPALIETESTLLADEALQHRLDQAEVFEGDFNARVKAGVTAWYWHCLGALLLPVTEEKRGRRTVEVVGVFKLSEWPQAQEFVRHLPRETFLKQKECMQDFFTGIGRESEFLRCWRSNARSARMALSLAEKIVSERISNAKQ